MKVFNNLWKWYPWWRRFFCYRGITVIEVGNTMTNTCKTI